MLRHLNIVSALFLRWQLDVAPICSSVAGEVFSSRAKRLEACLRKLVLDCFYLFLRLNKGYKLELVLCVVGTALVAR